MKLSRLQKYILLQCINSDSGKINRDFLDKFYLNSRKRLKSSKTKIISQSLDRLINREFLIGYGVKTPHKWFIKQVKLTSRGSKTAKKLLGQQLRLPLKNFQLKRPRVKK